MMALPQIELPRGAALAPAPAVAVSRARVPRLPLRWVTVGVGALLFGGLGYLAARETGSLAMGILAGDLAFLVAVAGWSTVGSGARR